MINKKVGRSYFHGADDQMLETYSQALRIPLIDCPTDGQDYATAFEQGLCRAKKLGATAACFGDIDLQQNRQWKEERSKNVGLSAKFPLWQCNREQNVHDLLDCGYKCLIKSVNTSFLPKAIVGRYLDETTLETMKKNKVDVCGENGEYHTLVVDGPIFQHPLNFNVGPTLQLGDYATATVNLT